MQLTACLQPTAAASQLAALPAPAPRSWSASVNGNQEALWAQNWMDVAASTDGAVQVAAAIGRRLMLRSFMGASARAQCRARA